MKTRTNSLKIKKNIFGLLSLLLLTGPFIVYLILGFSISNDEGRIVLGLCALISAVMLMINTVAKMNMRSIIWIMLLGIYIALSNITCLLVIVAVTTIIDEFIISPLYKSSKQKYIINKEIDKRG